MFRLEHGRQLGETNGTFMGRRWGRNFDENQLRFLIKTMTKRSRFYQVLKSELKMLGRWRNLPRGRTAVRSSHQGGAR